MIYALSDWFIWLNNFCCFSVPFYGFAIDVVDRRGPSNEIRHQLKTKRTKVTLYYITTNLKQNLNAYALLCVP